MQWLGFAFSVPKMVELVGVGTELLRRLGTIDPRGYRRVTLASRRLQRYGFVEAPEDDDDLRAGLFFWGAYRPPRPRARLPFWRWQTPRNARFVTPVLCYRLRTIADAEIDAVLRFLRLALPISADEFIAATIHI